MSFSGFIDNSKQPVGVVFPGDVYPGGDGVGSVLEYPSPYFNAYGTLTTTEPTLGPFDVSFLAPFCSPSAPTDWYTFLNMGFGYSPSLATNPPSPPPTTGVIMIRVYINAEPEGSNVAIFDAKQLVSLASFGDQGVITFPNIPLIIDFNGQVNTLQLFIESSGLDGALSINLNRITTFRQTLKLTA
jgi:hypothetical protein